MRKIKEAINNIFEKHTDKMLVFVVTNMIIAVVWYIVELFTIGGIQENGRDTIICLVMSFFITSIIYNKKIRQLLK